MSCKIKNSNPMFAFSSHTFFRHLQRLALPESAPLPGRRHLVSHFTIRGAFLVFNESRKIKREKKRESHTPFDQTRSWLNVQRQLEPVRHVDSLRHDSEQQQKASESRNRTPEVSVIKRCVKHTTGVWQADRSRIEMVQMNVVKRDRSWGFVGEAGVEAKIFHGSRCCAGGIRGQRSIIADARRRTRRTADFFSARGKR